MRPCSSELPHPAGECIGGLTVRAVAAAAEAVSWIQGCAVPAMMIDPEHFDTDEFIASARGMIGRVG